VKYTELSYKEKQAFEATLTPAQRAKIRKLEKQNKETLQPINWASHARDEQVRKELYVSLNIAARIEALEAQHAPKLQELRDQFKAIQEQLNQELEELAEARSQITSEPYHAAGQDPQAKAINAIFRQMREQQENKLNDLIATMTTKASA
jgi:hypothetical protein